jgi:hypothetical protein
VFVQKKLSESFESNPHFRILKIIIFNGNEIFTFDLGYQIEKIISNLSFLLRNLLFLLSNADSRVWFLE